MTTPGLQSFDIKKLGQFNLIENVDIELTNKCNFNCVYCYVEKDKITHLSPLVLKQIFKFCNENKVKNITLTGGEPFLYENFEFLMDLIEGTNFNITFFTNGSFLEDVLKNYDFTQISICLKRDCVNDELQALMCGVDKMPYDFWKLVTLLQNEVKEMTVHSALTSINYKELPKLYEILKRIKVPHYISRVVPRKDSIKKIIPTQDMCKEVFSTIGKINGKDVSIPFVGDIGCIKMYCSIFIDRFGVVHPCSNLPFIVGTVNEDNLNIQMEKIKMFRNINKEIQGKCRTCSDSRRCYGCRAIAYYLTGNYLAGDPLCWRK